MDGKFTPNNERIAIEVSNLAINYICPIAIGPDKTKKDNIYNAGTVSFVDTGDRKLMITNDHTLENYYKLKKETMNAKIRVEHLIFDSDDRIIDKSKFYDIVTFSIEEEELKQMNKNFAFSNEWPPNRAVKNEHIVFVGYPGNFRERVSNDEVKFEIVPFFGKVISSSDEKFTIYFDDNRQKLYGYRELSELDNIGGMSGSLVLRTANNKIFHLEPIGILFESSDDGKMILVRHLDFINSDGSIKKEIIQ